MTYNLSNFTDSNNFLDMSIASNQLVDGNLFLFVPVMIFAISFIALKSSGDNKSNFTVAGFITFGLSAMLWATELVPDNVLVASFVIFLFGIAALLIEP